MEHLPAAIAGALFLIAAAIAPKSRDKFAEFFGVQESPTSQPTAAPVTNSRQSVRDIPSNRTLTLDEMYILASHITENYFPRNISPQDLVTTAYVESSFRPWVERDEGFDRSTGLMQTLLGTAQDMYNKGYRAFGIPTRERLKEPLVSMYFGAAYFVWLKEHYSSKAVSFGDYDQFFIRAYNGGAGWQGTKNGPKNTEHYYGKWKKAYAKVGNYQFISTGGV